MGFFRGEDGALRIDRRAEGRTRIAYPAQLSLPGGNRQGQLVDISRTGAQMCVDSPPQAGASALLMWESHEVFCFVAWAKDGRCGLTFDRPLPREVFLAATKQNDDVPVQGPVANPGAIALGRKRSRLAVG